MDHDEENTGDVQSVAESAPDPAPEQVPADQLASDGDAIVDGVREETTVTDTVEESVEVTQPDEA